MMLLRKENGDLCVLGTNEAVRLMLEKAEEENFRLLSKEFWELMAEAEEVSL